MVAVSANDAIFYNIMIEAGCWDNPIIRGSYKRSLNKRGSTVTVLVLTTTVYMKLTPAQGRRTDSKSGGGTP